MKTNIIALKQAMVAKNLEKVTDLSEASGISRNTLSSILNGKSQPSSNTMYALVNVLELTPDSAGVIFFGNDLREM